MASRATCRIHSCVLRFGVGKSTYGVLVEFRFGGLKYTHQSRWINGAAVGEVPKQVVPPECSVHAAGRAVREVGGCARFVHISVGYPLIMGRNRTLLLQTGPNVQLLSWAPHSYRMTFTSKTMASAKRGYTLTEIIVVVTLIGILVGIGYSLLTKTTATGLTNAGNRNAAELNNCMNNLQAANANFSTGAAAVTQGTATSSATVTMPAAPATADIQTIITALTNGTGIASYGSTQMMSKAPTAASYNCAIQAGTLKPVFTYKGAGAQP